MTSTVGTAALNNTTFAYETAGAGRPLVFIHAGIADSRMWDRQFSDLADSFTVVRYDMRGFGRTPPAEGPYAHYEDLAALLTHLGLDRVSLVGCSMGSKTALDFALCYPERVDRLILSSPARQPKDFSAIWSDRKSRPATISFIRETIPLNSSSLSRGG